MGYRAEANVPVAGGDERQRLETRVERAVSIDGAMPSATERTHAKADLGRAGQAGGAPVPACARRALIESQGRVGSRSSRRARRVDEAG